jgi:hypothetical protein
MISHISLNFLSLADAANLKMMLGLYIFSERQDHGREIANRHRIAGIESLVAEPETRLIGRRMLSGQRLRLGCRSSHFASLGGLYVFGCVIERFLATTRPSTPTPGSNCATSTRARSSNGRPGWGGNACSERRSCALAPRTTATSRRSGCLRRAGVSNIRVRPHLSLGFPDNDIERIERMRGAAADGSEDAYRVTASFFGLYGVSSPLPTFYTEDLLDDEREGRHARRDFFDILHGALYPQLFDAWRKYRLQMRVVEEQDPEALDTLYAFAGLGSPAQRESLAPDAASLLRHLNLFAHRTRSVLGLRTLLADAFAPAMVRGRVLRAAVGVDSRRPALAARVAGPCVGRDLPARRAGRGLRQPAAAGHR